MNKFKNITALFLVMLLVITSVKAQGWEISEADKNEVNPLEISDANVEKGLELYSKNCQSCHGGVGEANFLPLVPPPGDLGAESFKLANTSGDIFFKVTNGMASMPSFAKTLSDEERWAVVAYLNPQTVELDGVEASKANSVSMDISANEETKKIVATLSGKNEAGEAIKVSGVKVEFFAKRYFGNLLLGKGKTNSSGNVALEFPQDLPKNTEGIVEIIVVAKDYKQEKKLEVSWGAENHHANITEEASVWGTNANAPWWIISLYVGIAGTVWFFIVYIALGILKLKKLGKQTS